MSAYGDFKDKELIISLKHGSKHAFAEIFNKYDSLLYTHVYKKIRDREEARDIVQEVFTTLWLKRDRISEDSNLGGYLMMAVKHKVLDLVGHKDVESRYFNSLASFALYNEGATDHRVREKQLQDIISREIAALPSKMQEIFLMSRVDQLSHKEIAQQLHISEETVNTQIKRALKALRVRLGLVLYIAMFFKL
jgi:RNA polymerase sigma-70 factor (family 1)